MPEAPQVETEEAPEVDVIPHLNHEETAEQVPVEYGPEAEAEPQVEETPTAGEVHAEEELNIKPVMEPEAVSESPEAPTSEVANEAEDQVEIVQGPENQEATNEPSEPPQTDELKVQESVVPTKDNVEHSTDLLEADNVEQDETHEDQPNEEELSESQKELGSIQVAEEKG